MIEHTSKLVLEEVNTIDYPIISVIIPVYNVERYVADCLKSVIGQTFKPIEIICVNDGSTDKSGEICLEYMKKDSRIKVIEQENLGLSEARNTGIRASRGQFIAFVDSDDWLRENYLETLYELCKRFNCDIAQCEFLEVEDTATLTNDTVSLSQSYSGVKLDRHTFVLNFFFKDGWRCIPVWNKLYAKYLFEDVSFRRGKQHEDEFFTYNIAWRTPFIAVTKEPLYFYRQRKNSIMGGGFTKSHLDAILAHEERVIFFKERDFEIYQFCLKSLWNTINDRLMGIQATYPEWKEKEKELICKLNVISRLVRISEFEIKSDFVDYKGLCELEMERERLELVISEHAKTIQEKNTRLDSKESYINKLILDNDMLTKKNNMLIMNSEENRKKIEEVKAKNVSCLEEISNLNTILTEVHESLSFKIGRIITWVPRQIRLFIKKCS